MSDPFPTRRFRPLAWVALLATLTLLSSPSCSTRRAPAAIKIPAVNGLRTASDILVNDVDTRSGPPKWLNHERVTQGYVYGIGTEDGGRHDSEDLFRAMQAARRTIIDFLQLDTPNQETYGVDQPNSESIDPNQIEFEHLAYDERARRWYALARLDIEQQSQDLETQASAVDERLKRLTETLEKPDAPDGAKLRAALAIAGSINQLKQIDALYTKLTGQKRASSEPVDEAHCLVLANAVLADHGVRIVVDGPQVAGLQEAINLVLGEAHLSTDEFGRGLITVHLHESNGFGPGNPYLEIDGSVEIALGGAGEQTYGSTFNVVSTGDSVEEARFRAARTINEEVSSIVRATLQSIAQGTES
ncbi:MAG: hypothetical protein P8M78_09430 [Myxococcota bacterium]|nr:hypothetical protein [Myxococcota bacterium]